MNRDEDVMIVRTLSDRSLGSYYLYERAGDRLTKLADRNPWLAENQLAPMKPGHLHSRATGSPSTATSRCRSASRRRTCRSS